MTKSNQQRRLSLYMILCSLLYLFGAANAYAKNVKTIRLTDDMTATVTISGRGTVLSFPLKPTKVILGKADSFGITYVERDLAISPLSPNARSHLFVYLYGRRFTFDLVTSMTEGSAVILVRDAKEPTGKAAGHE